MTLSRRDRVAVRLAYECLLRGKPTLARYAVESALGALARGEDVSETVGTAAFRVAQACPSAEEFRIARVRFALLLRALLKN